MLVSIMETENAQARTYGAKRRQTNNEERLELGELVEKYKNLYDAEVNSCRGKRKKHVPIKPRWGFLLRAQIPSEY